MLQTRDRFIINILSGNPTKGFCLENSKQHPYDQYIARLQAIHPTMLALGDDALMAWEMAYMDGLSRARMTDVLLGHQLGLRWAERYSFGFGVSFLEARQSTTETAHVFKDFLGFNGFLSEPNFPDFTYAFYRYRVPFVQREFSLFFRSVHAGCRFDPSMFLGYYKFVKLMIRHGSSFKGQIPYIEAFVHKKSKSPYQTLKRFQDGTRALNWIALNHQLFKDYEETSNFLQIHLYLYKPLMEHYQ